MSKNGIIIIVMFILLVCVLMIFLKRKENFCGTCSPLGYKRNMDRDRKSVLYQEGLLTENSPEVYRPWDMRGRM